MPRNLNGAGSIRKKTVKGKNGKDYIFYEARVTVGYDPTTGKQKTEVNIRQDKNRCNTSFYFFSNTN